MHLCWESLISFCRHIASPSAWWLQCTHNYGNFASLIRAPADTSDRLCPARHQHANESKRAATKRMNPRSLKPLELSLKPAQANKVVNVRLVSATAACARDQRQGFHISSCCPSSMLVSASVRMWTASRACSTSCSSRVRPSSQTTNCWSVCRLDKQLHAYVRPCITLSHR